MFSVKKLYEIIKEYPNFHLFITIKGREFEIYPVYEIDFDEYTRSRVLLYASKDKVHSKERFNKNISNFINFIKHTFEVSLDYKVIAVIEEFNNNIIYLNTFVDYKIDKENKRIILRYDLI